MFLAASLAPVMQANAEAMEPVNRLIWTIIAAVVIDGCVQCLCGAAFWLPAVKRLLIDYESEEYDEFDSNIDQYGVSLGPAITMSGPEFLKWLEENADDQPSDGTWLYIKFPEPLCQNSVTGSTTIKSAVSLQPKILDTSAAAERP